MSTAKQIEAEKGKATILKWELFTIELTPPHLPSFLFTDVPGLGQGLADSIKISVFSSFISARPMTPSKTHCNVNQTQQHRHGR